MVVRSPWVQELSYIYIYIYIDRERERESERDFSVCIYIYIYIYILVVDIDIDIDIDIDTDDIEAAHSAAHRETCSSSDRDIAFNSHETSPSSTTLQQIEVDSQRCVSAVYASRCTPISSEAASFSRGRRAPAATSIALDCSLNESVASTAEASRTTWRSGFRSE